MVHPVGCIEDHHQTGGNMIAMQQPSGSPRQRFRAWQQEQSRTVRFVLAALFVLAFESLTAPFVFPGPLSRWVPGMIGCALGLGLVSAWKPRRMRQD